jgi:hypothetical protein
MDEGYSFFRMVLQVPFNPLIIVNPMQSVQFLAEENGIFSSDL